MTVVGFALLFHRTTGDNHQGEYATSRGKSTPDLNKAKLYKEFKRAYTWGYFPQEVEIVEVSEVNGVRSARVVESRKAGITQMGDTHYDHLGNPTGR